MSFFSDLFKRKVKMEDGDAFDHIAFATSICIGRIDENISQAYLAYRWPRYRMVQLRQVLDNYEICKNLDNFLCEISPFISKNERENVYSRSVEILKSLGLFSRAASKEFLKKLRTSLEIKEKEALKIHKSTGINPLIERLIK